MPKFLIEVPHAGTTQACAQAIELFHRTGSHFLTHADWGCRDGVHKAWFIADVDTREDARNIVPPSLRPETTVIGLNDFTTAEIEHILNQYAV